jgi:hypothetical protein
LNKASPWKALLLLSSAIIVAIFNSSSSLDFCYWKSKTPSVSIKLVIELVLDFSSKLGKSLGSSKIVVLVCSNP